MAQRIVHYSPEMVEDTKQMLDLLGVRWVDAAAEGEGQAAVMAVKGQLDVVATQDWDALLYGSPILVRNLMSDGSKRHGRTVRAQKIVLSEMLAEHNLSRTTGRFGHYDRNRFPSWTEGIGPKTESNSSNRSERLKPFAKRKGRRFQNVWMRSAKSSSIIHQVQLRMKRSNPDRSMLRD